MEENLEKISGTVEDVIFKNTESGYIVFELDSEGQLITAVGELGDIAEGERLELYGSYTTSAKYGKQFKAVSCTRTPPATPAEIRKYLSSGIIRGVGPSLAKKIVDNYGEEALDIIENDPLRLAELKGVTDDRALLISSEYRKLSGMKTVVEFLQKYGISPAVAAGVWKKYEISSVAFIRDNPYILCDDELGVDFEQADAIAMAEGIGADNINRIIAAILYILRENANDGHTCLPLKKSRRSNGKLSAS